MFGALPLSQIACALIPECDAWPWVDESPFVAAFSPFPVFRNQAVLFSAEESFQQVMLVLADDYQIDCVLAEPRLLSLWEDASR